MSMEVYGLAPARRRVRTPCQQQQSAPHAALLMAAQSDPFFASVAVLLHLDSKTADAGQNSKIINNGYDTTQWRVGDNGAGGCDINGTTPKFGAGSAQYSGAGLGAIAPEASSSNFVLGNNANWTIEFWYYTPNSGSTYVLADWTSAKPEIYTQGGTFRFYNGSSTIINAGSVATNTYQFVTVSHAPGTTYMFIDGTLIGSAADTVNYTANLFGLGISQTNTFKVTGRIDEFRLTIGVCRYTASFTAPTAPFPNS